MHKLRDFLREAGAECASLLKDGYILRVHHYDIKEHMAYSKLKHCVNGNVITIYATHDGYQVYKNEHLIKTVT